MIDKTIIAYRFQRSVDTYDENANVQKRIAERLFSMLQKFLADSPARILEIGCGTGILTERLKQKWTAKELIINDLVGLMCSKAADKCNIPSVCCLTGDIEVVELPGKFDLIVSASTFQWLAHPQQTYSRLAEHLQAGGLFVFSSFGKDNLLELKSLTGQGLTYSSIAEQIKLLSPYFDILYTEESRNVLYFDTPLEILRHIKKTGVNAVRFSCFWTKGRLEEFIRLYTVRFLRKEGYPLTYHPFYIVCRKKS